jgi:hypothetical protein
MTADLARVTYDPTRQYRSVVAQQGRVTLEADDNEAAAIAGEALRLETIDVIGPTGTPDNGYAPGSGTGPGGVTIGPGIFYLGGWRLELDNTIDLSNQPDWLDMPATAISSGNMAVALLLTEQSVSAVEDQALREVAIGGPDSAARMRLMQHFLRLPVSASTCAAAAAEVAKQLAVDGVTIDPATLQLLSQARLQAGFVPGPPVTDPCTPAAAGGYLGADNQLVRVTVIAYDATAKTGTLLWGWNNASLLYRAKVTDPLTLTLIGVPVDGEHAPQLGQAVEILRSEANLGDGNFIAAPQGFVTTVAQAYSFDTGAVGLAQALPAEYASDKNPLFIRLWQAQAPFVAGQVTALDSVSGITVTITLPVLPSHIALRPFWRFAVRPSTPVQIYPQRYLEAPQPPDGPRQWLTDIAVMAAQPNGATLVQDCRVPFVPLTQQQGGRCCNLVLGPADVAARGGLQTVLDGLAGTNSGVSLLAGTYTLATPLTLGSKHAGLTLEGCGGKATLQAAAANLAAFAFGLIQLNGAANITLKGLVVSMPLATIGTGATQFSFGVIAVAAPGLTVEACSFQVPAPSATLTAAGMLIGGESAGLAVRCNRFVGARFLPGSAVFGVLAVPGNTAVATLLENAEISDNLFEQLNAGAAIFARLFLLRCTNNRVIECATGLYFADTNLGTTGQVARQALTEAVQSGPNATLGVTLVNSMQAPMLAGIANVMAQLPMMAAPSTAPTVSAAARQVLIQNIASRGTEVWRGLAPAAPAPAPTAGPPPAAAAPMGAPPAAAPAAAPIAKDQADMLAKSLDTVQDISIAATIVSGTNVPVLHISGNDVRLVSTVQAAAGAATGATTAVPGVGIGIVLPAREVAGAVLLTANRVVTADARTTAAGVLFPATAAVTGNLFIETGAEKGSPPAFALVAERTAAIEVAANVSIASELIFPPRSTAAAATSWDFLNTVS